MIKKLFNSFKKSSNERTIEVYKEKKRSTSSNECSSNESSLNQSNSNISNPTDSSTDQSINQNNSNEHNQCFIEDSDLVSLSTCDELDKNWTKLIYEEEQIKKLDSISSMSKFVKKNKRICDQESNKKSDKMIESFTNGLNVSGISRRRILANIDYSVDDGQFMCSTLIKDQEDCLKPKFQDLDECDSTKNESSINLTNHQNTLKKSNHKLELISKQMQEVETVQRHNKFFKKQNLINNKKLITSHHKTSTLNTNNSTTTADRLIYDTRKSISDLSSIEETRIDNLRNNLKNMQMNSIDKRRILKKYFNRDFNEKLDRNSIAKENFRSEMYNNENSTIINQIKKIQNYHNNQVVHDLNDQDTWFCKTKLYDDTLDEIVNKWNNLDYEIWCKIILFERNRRVAKAYIRLPYLIVTGSKIGFDGYSIGLNGFENIYRDQETEFIVKNLEKGVRIKIDEHGNLILRKMTHLSVQIKDWLQQLTEGTGSLSDDVIAMQGKIPYNTPVKVFDIDRFANNLRQELEKPMPNRRRLAKQCIIPIIIGKCCFNLLNSPSWLMVVNIYALRMIERITRIPEPDYGLSTLDDNIVCLKEEESGSSRCSDSMSNSEEDQYYSGFTSKKNCHLNNHIYSSI